MQIESLSITSCSSGCNSLGRWTFLKELGSGATSRVFLAINQATQEQVAVKVFTADPKTSFQLLQAEAEILQYLDHLGLLRSMILLIFMTLILEKHK